MWKVIGHFDASADTRKHAKGRDGKPGSDWEVVFGPHPRKAWVGPHVVKGFKRRKAAAATRACVPASVSMQAETYARWLAARDGIVIPAGATRARAAVVPFTTHRVRSSGRPVVEDRVLAVLFYIPGIGEPAVRIELPNWDFDPRDPVEEIVDDAATDDSDEWLFADAA
jgi:hypothetical protein